MKCISILFGQLLNPHDNTQTELFEAITGLKSKRALLVERMKPLEEAEDINATKHFREKGGWSFKMLVRHKLIEEGWPGTYENTMFADLFDMFFVLYTNADNRETFNTMYNHLKNGEDGQSEALAYIVDNMEDINRVNAALDDFGPDDLDDGQKMLFGKITPPKP